MGHDECRREKEDGGCGGRQRGCRSCARPRGLADPGHRSGACRPVRRRLPRDRRRAMIQPFLRSASIAIALAAFLDPALTVTARPRPRLAITLERPDDPVSLGVRARLTRDLGADFDVAGPDREAAAAVVIGREYPDRADAFPPRTSTVTLDGGHRGETAIISGVRAPRAVPRGTRIQLEVTLDAQPATAATSVVAVAAGPVGHPDVEVARVSHTWTAGSRRAVLTLDAMPLDLPPRSEERRVGKECSSGWPGEYAGKQRDARSRACVK